MKNTAIRGRYRPVNEHKYQGNIRKITYRSLWERRFMLYCDRSDQIVTWSSEELHIPYYFAEDNRWHNYYPDFVVVDTEGVHYLVETKGREDPNVRHKDRAATMWADSATTLTGVSWQYVKVLQKDFQALQPVQFADCAYLGLMQPSLFDDIH